MAQDAGVEVETRARVRGVLHARRLQRPRPAVEGFRLHVQRRAHFRHVGPDGGGLARAARVRLTAGRRVGEALRVLQHGADPLLVAVAAVVVKVVDVEASGRRVRLVDERLALGRPRSVAAFAPRRRRAREAARRLQIGPQRARQRRVAGDELEHVLLVKSAVRAVARAAVGGRGARRAGAAIANREARSFLAAVSSGWR